MSSCDQRSEQRETGSARGRKPFPFPSLPGRTPGLQLPACRSGPHARTRNLHVLPLEIRDQRDVAVSITLEQLSMGQNHLGKARNSTRCKPERLAHPRKPSDKGWLCCTRAEGYFLPPWSDTGAMSSPAKQEAGNPVSKCMYPEQLESHSVAFPAPRRALQSPWPSSTVTSAKVKAPRPQSEGGQSLAQPPCLTEGSLTRRMMFMSPQYPPSCWEEHPQLP